MTTKFKLHRFNWILLFMFVSSMKVAANQNAIVQKQVEPLAELTISPKQCVALNKGNDCFIDVELTWLAHEKALYCLHSSQSNEPLQCWENRSDGTFKGEIVLKNNVYFTLHKAGQETPLGSAILEIVWVYKKKEHSHSRWRMF